MDVQCQPGDLGQFQVVVDGEVVAQRETGVFKRMVSGGWPDPAQVVDAIGKRLARAKTKT